jgi:hypothetical protein
MNKVPVELLTGFAAPHPPYPLGLYKYNVKFIVISSPSSSSVL